MAPYMAQVVLKGKSGLPRDVFVNTFHFDKLPGDQAAELDGIFASLQELYVTAITSLASAITTYFSDVLDRTAGSAKVNVYDLDDPKPRENLLGDGFTLPATGFASAANLPGEVTLCASYFSERNLPRQRGRIHLGPLSSSAGQNDASEIFRPSVGFAQGCMEALVRLRDRTDSTWGVWSRPKGDTLNKDGSVNPARPGTFHPITNVWVDNEFDTQRRRGAKASLRYYNGPT